MASEQAEREKTLARRLDTIALDRMTQESAKQLCEENPEQAASLLMAILRYNTEALPQTSFVKRSADGCIVKRRTTVTLKESLGHLIYTGSKEVKQSSGKKEWVPQFGMSFDGIRELNRIAALHPLRPESVIVDGERRGNPYSEVNPDTRMTEVVYARCYAVGYTPSGNLVATDASVRLDLNAYFLENVQAKMKGMKSNPERLGIYGVRGSEPNAQGNWVFMPIHSVGGMGLWVNMAAPEFQDVMSAHTTRLKFATPLAQSFAERNAMKAHPAMPKSIQVENGVARFTMDSWTDQIDRAKLEELRELLEQDRLHEFKDERGQTIEIEQVHQEALDEEAIAAVEQEAAGEQVIDRRARRERGDESEQDDEEQPERKTAADKAKLLAEAQEAYSDYCSATTIAAGKKLLKELDIGNIDEASDQELTTLIDSIKKKLG